jgi:hypothetical protein
LAPSCTKSTSEPLCPTLSRSSDEAVEASELDDTENFLLGGAGGLRRTPLTGVADREPAVVVREVAEKLDAAELGRSVCVPLGEGWPRVRDSDTSLRDDWRTGSREV